MPQRTLVDRARVLELLAKGVRPTDVAKRLGIAKGTASQVAKEARS
jgi:DNA-binding NarL/FixJ family response regulator